MAVGRGPAGPSGKRGIAQWCRRAPAFKTKVALAAIKGGKTLAELTHQIHLSPNPITVWCVQLLEGATGVIGDPASMGSSAVAGARAVVIDPCSPGKPPDQGAPNRTG